MPNSRARFIRFSPAAAQFAGLFRRERFLPATICAALPCQRDALALPLADRCPFEFGEGAHDGQHQIRHRRILAGEDQTFLDELDPDAALRHALNDAPEVVEIAG